jgi:organic hydroperoxide reductase OsmC/OhrA
MHPVVQPPTLAVLYSSTAIATGGLLEGRVRTMDRRLDLVLAKPQQLGGTGAGPGHDPYQLLAAAYSASFLASLLGVRSQDGPQLPPDAAVQATVAFRASPGWRLWIGDHARGQFARLRTSGRTNSDGEGAPHMLPLRRDAQGGVAAQACVNAADDSAWATRGKIVIAPGPGYRTSASSLAAQPNVKSNV